MAKVRSSLHKTGSLGYKATRDGDAIRIDVYIGRVKVKNFCYFLDRSEWPQLEYQKWGKVNNLKPTLLKGPSLNDTGKAPTSTDDIVAAIEEVL